MSHSDTIHLMKRNAELEVEAAGLRQQLATAEQRAATAEAENERLQSVVRNSDPDLSGECIMLMRGHLERVGITAAFADDAAAMAAQEIATLRAERDRLAAVVENLRQALPMLSPGPYQWAIIPAGPEQEKWIIDNLRCGSGDVHLIGLPSHELSDIGSDPMNPEHLVVMCITGNGPKSKDNALGLLCVLDSIAALATRPSDAGKETP